MRTSHSLPRRCLGVNKDVGQDVVSVALFAGSIEAHATAAVFMSHESWQWVCYEVVVQLD